jgi:hypothetical protein
LCFALDLEKFTKTERCSKESSIYLFSLVLCSALP